LEELATEFRCLYAKAVDAVKAQNHDDAATLLNQLLAEEPGLIECRKALRQLQSRRNGGASTGFIKKILNSAGSSPQIARAKLALHKHPAEALALAESVLNSKGGGS
jgi:hypothetical protein